MSIAAWTALEARFEALAAGGDYRLWLAPAEYQFVPPCEMGRIRQMLRGERAQAHFAHAVAAVVADDNTSGHDDRYYRLRWLCWAAGRLAEPGFTRPELGWLAAVAAEYAEPVAAGVRSVEHLVRAAADEAARRATGRFERTLPTPSSAGSWQLPFRALRDDLCRAAVGQPGFHIELISHPESWGHAAKVRQPWLDGVIERQQAAGRSVSTLSGNNFVMYGESGQFAEFRELAEQAGRHLPEWLVLDPPLLPDVADTHSLSGPAPLRAWLEFLWAANTANYTSAILPDTPAARLAHWQGGNPLRASALAIDRFLLGYDAESWATLGRHAAEVCPWYGPEDRAAVRLAMAEPAAPATAHAAPGRSDGGPAGGIPDQPVGQGEPPANGKTAEPPNYFRRHGQGYEARFRGGPKVILTGRKSAAVVHRLLTSQGREVRATDLTDPTGRLTAAVSQTRGQSILDPEARASASARWQELQADQERFRRDGDHLAAADAQAEIVRLAAELSATTGLGGRDRKMSDETGKARTAVYQNVARVVKAIRAVDGRFADHLERSIDGGQSYRYAPSEPVDWDLFLQP